MNAVINEEIQYCTTCGAANKKSAVYCEHCRKKVVVRHRPVVDFLKKRVKNKLAGDITENIFSLLKDFLLNHLYGAVLTVSVVASVTVAASNSTPYIKKVDTSPFEKAVSSEETTVPEIPNGGVFEVTDKDVTRLKHVTTAYDGEIDNTKRSGTTYWSDPEEYSSATELWAENAIEGYPFKGLHELYDNPYPMGQDILAKNRYNPAVKHYRYTPAQSARTGINVNSAMGQTLLDAGYEVLEVDYYCLTYNTSDIGNSFDFKALPPANVTPYEKYVYTFLLTRKYGTEKWYIAEEVLTEKSGGPKNS